MVCKADTRMYTGLGKNGPTSSGFCCCSCCLCTGVLVVGITSFRERERIPGFFGEACVVVCVVCCDRREFFQVRPSVPLGVTLASPFIVPKGRDRVTFGVKR
jgi:hypothetical protein